MPTLIVLILKQACATFSLFCRSASHIRATWLLVKKKTLLLIEPISACVRIMISQNFGKLEFIKKSPGGGGGGYSTFFQVGVCGPDFRSVGLANWHLPLKRGACERKISKFGGLWAENFQIWGACALKISKFGGLWAENFQILGACELKISKFSQKGVLWTDSFAWNGTLASGRRGVKRGSSGPHIPIPPF